MPPLYVMFLIQSNVSQLLFFNDLNSASTRALAHNSAGSVDGCLELQRRVKRAEAHGHKSGRERGGVGAAIGGTNVRELRYHNSSGRQRHRSSNNNSSSQLGAGVVTRGWKGNS
ncbi:hypothetical protein NL676_006722 [Syzygium grande]|nr:hypothetical protein NL676_006722 [Syzygium grande]